MRDQGLKWKRRPTSGSTIEFGRDAIELICKIKIAIEDLIWTNHNRKEGQMWERKKNCGRLYRETEKKKRETREEKQGRTKEENGRRKKEKEQKTVEAGGKKQRPEGETDEGKEEKPGRANRRGGE